MSCCCGCYSRIAQPRMKCSNLGLKQISGFENVDVSVVMKK